MGILTSVLSEIAEELGDETSANRQPAPAEAAMESAIADHAALRTKAATGMSDAPIATPMPSTDTPDRRVGAERRQLDIELPEGFEDRRAGLDRRRHKIEFGKRGGRSS